ncbi:MAG: ABC transporter permease [Euryarchaeota archaeon]|nr:ABC transporter permease [Euryarchaeota archaeon]MDE1837723.1 ABC transporter permease [Euryarchaeota archaeon]MDE1880951.1 ABC transporter permease [Euryarchaeota archaeon]MDE2046114.1 ABC transporter permease [Thermoplasmata archaeon]
MALGPATGGGGSPARAAGPRLSRVRARPPNLFARLGAVALYELKWDLRKFWVYLTAAFLLGLAIIGVLLMASMVAPTRAPGELVTFVSAGLPAGQSWTITVGGGDLAPQVMNTTAGSLQVYLPNGTYNFTVGTAASHATTLFAEPVQGDLLVQGAPLTQGVRFAPIPGAGGGLDDAQAITAAESVADSLGGNWTAVDGSGWLPGGVVGEDLTAASTNSSAASDGICELTGGTGRWPTVPASTGNYSNGREGSWLVQLTAGFGTGWLFVSVQGGRATLIGGVNDTCGSAVYGSGTSERFPVNSTEAATSLLRFDSPYLSSHPRASSSFSLRSTGDWSVLFTTCAPGGGGTGANFTASVDARTGSVLTESTTSGACAVPPAFLGTFPRSGPPSALNNGGQGSGGGPPLSRSTVWLDAILALNGFGILPVAMWAGRPSGVESIARERDKGTLGALLQQPLRRSELLLGKWFVKMGLLTALSFLAVGVVVALSTMFDGPQQAVLDAPWIALDLSLMLGFVSALALLFSTLVKRSKNASHLVTLFLFLGLLVGKAAGAWVSYFFPLDSAFLTLSGTRLFLLQPTGTVFVTSLPQSYVTNPYFFVLRFLLVWGTSSSYQMALWSSVGLIVDTVAVLVLAILALRRIEIKG